MKSNLVSVSNTFVGASYSLSLVEKRLILAFVSSIDNNICKKVGEERDNLQILSSDKYYEMSVTTFADIYSISYEQAKDELTEAIEKLYEQEVRYVQADGGVVRTRWISTVVTYDKERHVVMLSWAKGIIPLISELRSNFTSYRLRFLSTLPSVYSLRLYEIFIMELNKQHKGELIIWLDVEVLRTMFDLHTKYVVFGDFVKRVVIGPIGYINKDKNCNVTVKLTTDKGRKLYKKVGKKVVSIGFHVNWRKKLCYQEVEAK